MKIILQVNSFKLIPECEADKALFRYWEQCSDDEEYETHIIIEPVEEYMYVEFIKDANKVENK